MSGAGQPGAASEALARADAGADRKSASAASEIMPCQEQRFAIEVLALQASSKPLAGMAVELRDGQGAAQTKTDPDGVARFEGLADQAYELSLYALADDSWEMVDMVALERPVSTKPPPPWGATAAQEQPASVHTVTRDECVTKLANRYGLTADRIWQANHALARQRISMNILAAGDQVTIPARAPKWEPASPGMRHIVKQTTQPSWLRVRFLDEFGAPRTALPYLMSLTTLSEAPVPDVEGETDADGFVIQHIPADAATATITLGQGDEQEVHVMHLSRLEPVETTAGLQARLANLGYGCGEDEDEGTIGPATESALRRFQQDRGLSITGKPDDATRRTLVEVHLS
jgi:hypothetical protein